MTSIFEDDFVFRKKQQSSCWRGLKISWLMLGLQKCPLRSNLADESATDRPTLLRILDHSTSAKKPNDLTLLANEFTRSLKLRHRPTPYLRVGLLCTQHNTVPYRYDLGARLVNLSLTPCLLALGRLFKESRDPLLCGSEWIKYVHISPALELFIIA